MGAFSSLALGLAFAESRLRTEGRLRDNGGRVPTSPPKRGRGRPRKPTPNWWNVPPRRKRGAPPKFTRDDEQWFLSEIDAWETSLADGGIRPTAATALRLSIAAHFVAQRLKGQAPTKAAWVRALVRSNAAAAAVENPALKPQRAISLNVTLLLTQELLAVGHTADEAKRRARAIALELDRHSSQVFRRRSEHLSRLRSPHRKRPV